MFEFVTKEEFTRLAEKNKRVIVFKEILSDTITPVQAFQALRDQMKGATMLESSLPEAQGRQYSFMGFNPQAQLCINSEKELNVVLDEIRSFYKANHAVSAKQIPGFAGGLAGFFSYDAVGIFEEKLKNKRSHLPYIVLKAYQDHLIFDHKDSTLILATVVDVENDSLYDAAIARLNKIHDDIISAKEIKTNKALADESNAEIKSNMDDAAYIHAGSIAQEHIQAGDAFQIVLARTFERKYSSDPFDIYRVLRFKNPSPYMFYLDHDDMVFCGASPEIMVRLENNQAISCPLAGTRPRGKGYEDAVQSKDLLSDPKEVAEHMMLVDLARNDLGKVAKIGEVKISALKQIKQFSHVMHISSTVEATLEKGKDGLDALVAAFPAGTLSGAPKIRAMEIIEDLEAGSRGLYGGAIGFFDNSGNFDSCIAIRMAMIKNGKAYVTAGAGITADSDLQKEADETRHKVRAVLEAIDVAERGLA